MKKLSFFALVAAGLLFGACSSDKEDISNPSSGVEFLDGAYIGVSIQLPNEVAGTRANEDFEDGETDEFAVKDATLYIFKGAAGGAEGDATFYAQYTLGTDYAMDGGSNVTSTYSNAVKIDNPTAVAMKGDASSVYYAYVIVNNNSAITTAPTKDVTTFTAFSNQAFSVIGADIAAEKNIGAGGLLMTNAPVADKAGGSAAPASGVKYSTLAVLDQSKIYGSASDARANEAACIFVERAAAKITVSETVASGSEKVGTYAYTFEGWQIFNYPTTYYNTRHIQATWGSLTSASTVNPAANQYRFVSGTAFAPQLPETHTGPFRTYWAEDLTYDADATLTRTAAVVADENWIGFGKSGYTTENTFDVARQTWQNTTQVAVRLKFNGGNPFYMIVNDDAIYDESAAETKLQNLIMNVPEVSGLLAEACTAISNRTAGTPTITSSVTVEMPASPVAGNQTYTVTYAFDNAGTAVTLEDTDVKGTDKYSDLINSAIATAKASFTADYYAGGYAYYAVRVKHFGDVETPWSAASVTGKGETIAEVYGADPTATSNYLGRYGIVRDNWYNITVDAVSKIGSATPIDVSGKGNPDDEVENYISVHVHIVPWVIRTQHETL